MPKSPDPRPNSPTLNTPTFHSSRHPSRLQELAEEATARVLASKIPPEYNALSPDQPLTDATTPAPSAPELPPDQNSEDHEAEEAMENPTSGSEPQASPLPPEPTPPPLDYLLMQELKRVREHTLAAYYQSYYTKPFSPPAPELTQALQVINGALSLADVALISRDANMMLASLNMLARI